MYLALCGISDSCCCFVNTVVLSVVSSIAIKSHKVITLRVSFLVLPLYEVDGNFLNTGDS